MIMPDTLTLEEAMNLASLSNQNSMSNMTFPSDQSSMSFNDLIKDANRRKSAPVMNLIAKAKDKLNKKDIIDVCV